MRLGWFSDLTEGESAAEKVSRLKGVGAAEMPSSFGYCSLLE